MDEEAKRELIRTYLLRYITGRLSLKEVHDDTVKLLFRAFDIPFNEYTLQSFKRHVDCSSHCLPIDECSVGQLYGVLTIMSDQDE